MLRVCWGRDPRRETRNPGRNGAQEGQEAGRGLLKAKGGRSLGWGGVKGPIGAFSPLPHPRTPSHLQKTGFPSASLPPTSPSLSCGGFSSTAVTPKAPTPSSTWMVSL